MISLVRDQANYEEEDSMEMVEDQIEWHSSDPVDQTSQAVDVIKQAVARIERLRRNEGGWPGWIDDRETVRDIAERLLRTVA